MQVVSTSERSADAAGTTSTVGVGHCSLVGGPRSRPGVWSGPLSARPLIHCPLPLRMTLASLQTTARQPARPGRPHRRLRPRFSPVSGPLRCWFTVWSARNAALDLVQPLFGPGPCLLVRRILQMRDEGRQARAGGTGKEESSRLLPLVPRPEYSYVCMSCLSCRYEHGFSCPGQLPQRDSLPFLWGHCLEAGLWLRG